MTTDASALWDAEYRSRGLPSSLKDAPSTTVLWGLANLQFLRTNITAGDTVLDLGCGTGRNAIAVAARTGARVVGIDYAGEAVKVARGRLERLSAEDRALLTFVQHDLRDGVPADTGSVALVVDVFVYFHLLTAAARAAYRAEVRRVLRPDGVLLLCLAPTDDGYYAGCPTDAAATEGSGGVTVGVDPHVGVGHVLHTLETLRREVEPTLHLVMGWRKTSVGAMHGATYDRVVLATLWRAGD